MVRTHFNKRLNDFDQLNDFPTQFTKILRIKFKTVGLELRKLWTYNKINYYNFFSDQ